MSETLLTARDKVWQVVRMIPKGHVATYGQVADLAGIPGHARLVGRILAGLPAGTRLPWHRVVNAQGRISNPTPDRQKQRLDAEGVVLINGRVSLRSYRWQP